MFDSADSDKTKFTVVLGVLLLSVCGVGFLYWGYAYGGKIYVERDGEEMALPDHVAVARAIQNPDLMSDFEFNMVLLRLKPREVDAILLDYQHYSLKDLPSKIRRRLKAVRDL